MPDTRVLFLMHEGVGPTIFQSQVAVHALEMRKHGFDIEVWSYETAPWQMESSRRNLARLRALGELRIQLLRGLYVFLPLSDLVNALVLWTRLRRARARFDLVHARTDYSASVYSYVARYVGIPMLWDCRGDAYPETEQALDRHPRIPRFVRQMLLRAIARHERRAGAACAGANFVSRLLSERKADSLGPKPAFVIPCSVSTRYFHFDPALRDRVRSELSYGPQDIVLIYSGALSTYQGFGAYVELVRTIRDRGETNVRLLVITPDRNRARDHLDTCLPTDAYQLRTASYAEMNAYLNAADYGMLLRDKSPINEVASPTKFGEFCLTGLPVILDGNVQQTIEISTAIGNQESYEAIAAGKRLQSVSPEEREGFALRARVHFAREHLNQEYASMYRSLVASGATRPAPPHR